jgi:hypothetical protein
LTPHIQISTCLCQKWNFSLYFLPSIIFIYIITSFISVLNLSVFQHFHVRVKNWHAEIVKNVEVCKNIAANIKLAVTCLKVNRYCWNIECDNISLKVLSVDIYQHFLKRKSCWKFLYNFRTRSQTPIKWIISWINGWQIMFFVVFVTEIKWRIFSKLGSESSVFVILKNF